MLQERRTHQPGRDEVDEIPPRPLPRKLPEEVHGGWLEEFGKQGSVIQGGVFFLSVGQVPQSLNRGAPLGRVRRRELLLEAARDSDSLGLVDAVERRLGLHVRLHLGRLDGIRQAAELPLDEFRDVANGTALPRSGAYSGHACLHQPNASSGAVSPAVAVSCTATSRTGQVRAEGPENSGTRNRRNLREASSSRTSQSPSPEIGPHQATPRPTGNPAQAPPRHRDTMPGPWSSNPID